jgi:hypothetical protein
MSWTPEELLPLEPFRRRIAAQDFEGFGVENVPQTFPTKV